MCKYKFISISTSISISISTSTSTWTSICICICISIFISISISFSVSISISNYLEDISIYLSLSIMETSIPWSGSMLQYASWLQKRDGLPMKFLHISCQQNAGVSTIVYNYNDRIQLNRRMMGWWLLLQD